MSPPPPSPVVNDLSLVSVSLDRNEGPLSQIGILGYGSFFLGYWDITSFKLGYWDIQSQIWDIALMSISGTQVSLTGFRIWALQNWDIGIWVP